MRHKRATILTVVSVAIALAVLTGTVFAASNSVRFQAAKGVSFEDPIGGLEAKGKSGCDSEVSFEPGALCGLPALLPSNSATIPQEINVRVYVDSNVSIDMWINEGNDEIHFGVGKSTFEIPAQDNLRIDGEVLLPSTLPEGTYGTESVPLVYVDFWNSLDDYLGRVILAKSVTVKKPEIQLAAATKEEFESDFELCDEVDFTVGVFCTYPFKIVSNAVTGHDILFRVELFDLAGKPIALPKGFQYKVVVGENIYNLSEMFSIEPKETILGEITFTITAGRGVTMRPPEFVLDIS